MSNFILLLFVNDDKLRELFIMIMIVDTNYNFYKYFKHELKVGTLI